jgi:hypothetical protein
MSGTLKFTPDGAPVNTGWHDVGPSGPDVTERAREQAEAAAAMPRC